MVGLWPGVGTKAIRPPTRGGQAATSAVLQLAGPITRQRSLSKPQRPVAFAVFTRVSSFAEHR